MSDKTRRDYRSKRNRRILISAVAIFLVLISVLAYAASLRPQVNQNQQTEASSKYFAISDLAGTYTTSGGTPHNSTNPGPMVLINYFGFNFTPVGGDANDVRIFVEGFDNPHSWEGERIPNGTSTYSGDIRPSFALPSQRQSDGTYTLKIRIAAREADGNVILNFTALVNLFGT
jgi:hypothetical protein